jgi:hypothetical protein
MQADGRLHQLADGGGEQGSDQGNVRKRRRGYRVRPVFIMLLFKIVRISQPAEGMKDGIMFPLLLF